MVVDQLDNSSQSIASWLKNESEKNMALKNLLYKELKSITCYIILFLIKKNLKYRDTRQLSYVFATHCIKER